MLKPPGRARYDRANKSLPGVNFISHDRRNGDRHCRRSLATRGTRASMTERFENLPIEIRQRVFSFFTHDADGTFIECKDKNGFYRFLAENISQYPVLANLVTINEIALVEHARTT